MPIRPAFPAFTVTTAVGTCAYRCFEDATLTQASSLTEHLLKHTERIKGQVDERVNVSLIDRELDTFTCSCARVSLHSIHGSRKSQGADLPVDLLSE